MPRIIQLVPQGLQGLFNIKGEAMPSPLSKELGAVLDLRRWYLETAGEIVTEVAVPGAIGNVSFTSMVVPPTEWWHVSAFTVEVGSVGTGETVEQVQPGALIAPAGLFVPVGQGIVTFTGSGIAAGPIAGGITDFYLPPGSGLGCRTGVTTAGATFTLFPAARITRLPI